MSIEEGENLNFAIPINDAKRLLFAKSPTLSALPNEPEEPEARTTSKQATPQEKLMCTAAAKQSFEEGGISNDPIRGITITSRWYVNHYDPESGACFVMTFCVREYTGSSPAEMDISVDDVLEHKNYAYFHGRSDSDSGLNSDASFYKAFEREISNKIVPACRIEVPKKKPTIWCTTNDEFISLVEKHFNISW